MPFSILTTKRLAIRRSTPTYIQSQLELQAGGVSQPVWTVQGGKTLVFFLRTLIPLLTTVAIFAVGLEGVINMITELTNPETRFGTLILGTTGSILASFAPAL